MNENIARTGHWCHEGDTLFAKITCFRQNDKDSVKNEDLTPLPLKYILKKHRALRNQMVRIYPNPQDFVDSPAVTRLNGYAGGHGTGDQLSREIDILGLSAEGKKRLADLVRR